MVLVPSPLKEQCRSCVVIPAKNEARHIEPCLQSLFQQRDFSGQRFDPASFEIILLVNNTSDNTAQLARDLALQAPDYTVHIVEVELAEEQANVGYARKLLMDEACRRLLGIGLGAGCIATTDADTCVNKTWLAATLRAIEAGAEGVGGRIYLCNTDSEASTETDHAVAQCYRWLTAYNQMLACAEGLLDPQPYDPNPRHNQHSGASLAITALKYREIGGLPPLAFEEDVGLYQALRFAGGRFRHCPNVKVRTSARSDGRVLQGLSSDSRRWRLENQHYLKQPVERCEQTLARFKARADIRTLWFDLSLYGTASAAHRHKMIDKKHCESLAANLHLDGINGEWLAEQLKTATHPERVIVAIERNAPPVKPQDCEPLWNAMAKLRECLRQLHKAETKSRSAKAAPAARANILAEPNTQLA